MANSYLKALAHLADPKLAKKMGGVRKLGRFAPTKAKFVKDRYQTKQKPLNPGVVWTSHELAVAEAKAKIALWTELAASLEFRHPDPAVKVTCIIENYIDTWSTPRGLFMLTGARDSRTGEVMPSFHMPLAFKTWPGKRCAELFLVSCWALLMVHEAAELVNRCGGQNSPDVRWPGSSRVLDFHDHNDYVNQRLHAELLNAAQGYGGLESMENVVAMVLGKDRARELFSDVEPARKELEAKRDTLVKRIDNSRTLDARLPVWQLIATVRAHVV